jgi:hypothetical protein
MKELSNIILDFNHKSSDNIECSFSLFVGATQSFLDDLVAESDGKPFKNCIL